MPFPKELAQWVKRSQDNQCIAVHYSEEQGFIRCPNPVEHVHHIEPESWVLHGNEDFFDPNQSTAAGLCKDDHKAKHPDLKETYEAFRHGAKDAFKTMAHNHSRLSSEGVVYWNSDGDESLRQRVRETQMMYAVKHQEDKKPKVLEHPKTKRTQWTDIFLGVRTYPEDEKP